MNRYVATTIFCFASLLCPEVAMGKTTQDWRHSEQPTTTSPSDNGFYVRANLVLPTRLQVQDYVTAFRLGGGAAFGWHFCKHLSAELEAMYLSAPLTINANKPTDDFYFVGWTRKMHSFNTFVNLTYQMLPDNTIKPFIGLGAGVGRHSVGDVTNSQGTKQEYHTRSTNRFVYQVAFGMEWVLRKNVSFLFDARWMNLGKAVMEFGSPIVAEKKSVTAQSLSVGMKFKF